MKLKLLSLAISPFIATPTLASEWEINSDLKYTDGLQSDVVSYEDNGDFDKRKIKKKRKAKLDTVITYSSETVWPKFSYQWRFGQMFERVKEHNIQLKEDGSLRKNKSLTELERITYAGLGFSYTHNHTLGADRWAVKGYIDRMLHISYGATDLEEDADARSGSSNNGYKAVIKSIGEYSTPWPSLYAAPFFRYKEEYKDSWHNNAEDETEDEERERQYEIGLFASWITPVPGLELIVGPYWQREVDYKRAADSDWESEEEKHGISRLKLEYESDFPGLEMEFYFEEHLNGDDEGEQVYKFELSYEF